MNETGFFFYIKKSTSFFCFVFFVFENNNPKSAPVKKRKKGMKPWLLKLYNIYKSGSKCSVRVGDIFFAELYMSKAHPACGKVPSNPINRHGALPGAGRLSEGGGEIII